MFSAVATAAAGLHRSSSPGNSMEGSNSSRAGVTGGSGHSIRGDRGSAASVASSSLEFGGSRSQMTAEERRLVIIAIEPSDVAENAFDWYVNYLHRPENEVLAMHITDSTSDVEKAQRELESGDVTGSTEDLYSQITELEERFRHKLATAKITGSVVSVAGKSAGQALVEAVKVNHAFCVVMGSRGQGRMKRVLFGSVSDHVMHHAEVPVIVVRPQHLRDNEAGGSFRVKDGKDDRRHH